LAPNVSFPEGFITGLIFHKAMESFFFELHAVKIINNKELNVMHSNNTKLIATIRERIPRFRTTSDYGVP
jgi:hypothetical protein